MTACPLVLSNCYLLIFALMPLALSFELGKRWFLRHRTVSGWVQASLILRWSGLTGGLAGFQAPHAPGRIRQLRQLFIQAFPEGEKAGISLAAAIKAVEDYVAQERRNGDGDLQISLLVPGETGVASIDPQILLPLVENGFRQARLVEMQNKYIAIVIRLNKDLLTAELTWSKPRESSTLHNGNLEIQEIDKRLKQQYPRRHELRALITEEEFSILLRLDLRGRV